MSGTLVTGVTSGGGAVLLGADNSTTFISPLHRRPDGAPDTFKILQTRDAQDTAMPTRNPGLAPNNHIEGNQKKLRDKLSFADRGATELRRHYG